MKTCALVRVCAFDNACKTIVIAHVRACEFSKIPRCNVFDSWPHVVHQFPVQVLLFRSPWTSAQVFSFAPPFVKCDFAITQLSFRYHATRFLGLILSCGAFSFQSRFYYLEVHVLPRNSPQYEMQKCLSTKPIIVYYTAYLPNCYFLN